MSATKRYEPNSSTFVVMLCRDHGEYVLYSDYAALAAENERLKASQLSLEKWIACEQVHFEAADNLREKLYQASVQIERLVSAGDGIAEILRNIDHSSAFIAAWNAAKEGRDANGCFVNHNKVAQYLPKPNTGKEGDRK